MPWSSFFIGMAAGATLVTVYVKQGFHESEEKRFEAEVSFQSLRDFLDLCPVELAVFVYDCILW